MNVLGLVTRGLLAPFAVVILAAVPAAVGVRSSQEPPKPTVTPTPTATPTPTPDPADDDGLINRVKKAGSSTSSSAPRPTPTKSPDPKPGAPGAPASNAALDAYIAQLTALIAEYEPYLEQTIPVETDMDWLAARANEYRQRYELMRERLYLGDPGVGKPVAKALAEFEARWGTLAAKIWAGDRLKAVISVPEWERLRADLRAWTKCSVPATFPEVVATGVLGRSEWACLNDLFFATLADYETRTNHSLAVERDGRLEPLGAALDTLEQWMRQSARLRRAAPDNPELLRTFTWRVNRAWLASAVLRRDELNRLRQVSKDTPFQRFLSHAPAVPGPPEAGVTVVVIDIGHQLTARVGEASQIRRVAATKYPDDGVGLARQLHDKHYQLRTLQTHFEGVDANDLRDFSRQLQVDIAADPRVIDPRDTPRYRAEVAAKERELNETRPDRIARESRNVSQALGDLVKKIRDR